MRYLTIILFSMISSYAGAQPNCNVYKMENNEACYQACLTATQEAAGAQGTRTSQQLFDKAIELCPTLDYAYFEKSVPYLKRGEFVTWKKLIDKAVELNPMGHLGYRGWCRYQFIRDYRGAIADLERLDSLTPHDIGYSANGDYHLNIAKALCYKALGQKDHAIKVIEAQLGVKDYSPLAYDYLHLAILNMETGKTEDAIINFKRSIALNDYLADPYYFLGLIARKKGALNESREYMLKAKQYYLKGYKRFDPYTHPMDKVFLEDIERELAK